MLQRVFILNKETPALIFNAPVRSTLWVDRIVFNTDDPVWSNRIAAAQLTVCMMVDENDDDGGQLRFIDKQVKSIGALNRNSFMRPVFDIDGGWSFTPSDSIVPSTPHTWTHGVVLGGSLKLKGDESVSLTIRTKARWLDFNSLIHEAQASRLAQLN